ncbi:MAG: hypothetical protein ACRDI2_08320 [Chloroflexota bacterium]
MTIQRTKRTPPTPTRRQADAATAATPAEVAAAPAEAGGPWDAPRHTKEDSKGWRTIYRGNGQRRQVKSVLELELTPEQDAWLDRVAEAAGLTPHALLSKLIDDARAAEDAAPRALRAED